MRRATIKDVAEKAKVSLKTVSRVINNEPSVMQATRARVLRAVAELDYEPDPSARNLRSGTTFVVGLVYDNPNPYHIIGVQNGVLAACRETGFGLQIHPCDSSSPMLAEELADWVARSRLAGLVLTAPMSERRDLVQALTARGRQPVPDGRRCGICGNPADGPDGRRRRWPARGPPVHGFRRHLRPGSSAQRWTARGRGRDGWQRSRGLLQGADRE